MLVPPPTGPTRMVDYAINVADARQICEQGQYPPSFAYPLPAVLLFRAVDSLGPSAGALAWLLLLSASLIGCLLLSERLVQDGGGPYRGVVIAIAFAAVDYYVIWDLCATNVNSIYLLLVLLAAWCWREERPILAGVLFAASVSLKVYSIVFLPYLVARKEWRMAWAMAISLVVPFVAVPVLSFGWHDALLLSRSWIDGILITSRPEFCLTYDAYKVSLSWTALVLMDPAASQGTLNLFNGSIAAAGVAVKAGCLAWGLLVAGYFVSAFRAGSDQKRKKLAAVLDISVLLFCAFPASSFLQPHHLMVLVVPAVCLVHVALDRGFPAISRIVAGSTVGLGFCLTHFGPHGPNGALRGVGVMSTLVAYLIGVWLTRRACRPTAVISGTDVVPGTAIAGPHYRVPSPFIQTDVPPP